MTGTTIIVDAAGQFRVGNPIVVGIGLMLVLVVTEVLRCGVRFVLAIAGHRRPGELERQKNEQENGKPATHAADSSSHSFNGPGCSMDNLIWERTGWGFGYASSSPLAG